MLPTYYNSSTDFRTVFVFALRPILPMWVLFFCFNGNYNGKTGKTLFFCGPQDTFNHNQFNLNLTNQVWSHEGSTFKKDDQNSRPGVFDPYVNLLKKYFDSRKPCHPGIDKTRNLEGKWFIFLSFKLEKLILISLLIFKKISF